MQDASPAILRIVFSAFPPCISDVKASIFFKWPTIAGKKYHEHLGSLGVGPYLKEITLLVHLDPCMQGHALDHMFTHLSSKRPHDPGLNLFHILTVESTKCV